MQRRRKTTKEERVCSVCFQHFAKAEHLNRHIRSHTKEKPFRCTVCDRNFARQDTLLRHSRSYHTSQHKTPESIPHLSETQGGNNPDGDVFIEPSFDDADANASSVEAINVFDSLSQEAIQASSQGQSASSVPKSNGALAEGPIISSNNSRSNMPAGGTYPMPILDQQNSWLPQWDTQLNLGTEWLAELTRDLPSMNWLGSACGTTSQPTDLAQQPLDPELMSLPEPSVNDRPADSIQKRWHTYSNTEPAINDQSDLSKHQYEVDEACRQTLTDRLRQRVQDGPIPSTTFLNLAIQAYFANFHPIFPIIHAPSFRSHSKNGRLLLSICSVGSLFLGSPRAVSYGIDMYERLHKAQLSSWELYLTTPRQNDASIRGLQATILGQMFGLLVGRPRDLMQIDLFHGLCVAWSRQLRLPHVEDFQLDISHLDGEQLETAWKEWANIEEIKRLVLSLHLQDTEIASLLHHDPLMRQVIEELPRTASNEAFCAPDPKTWKSIMMNQATSGPIQQRTSVENLENLINFRTVLNEFELQVLLRCICSVALERSKYPSGGTNTVRQCRETLVSWHKQYRHSSIFQAQESSLMMLWHSAFMQLHMDLDMLECFCGRDGPDVSERYREVARTWAASDDARVCIAHASLIVRHFERIPIGSEPPIHSPLCLYRCGVAWFCYTKFANEAATCARGELELPELRAIEMKNLGLFDDAVFTDGRPNAGPLVKVINLLQRGGQSRLGRHLASTLLSLVECDLKIF